MSQTTMAMFRTFQSSAVEERRLVGAGQVEDRAGHPAAERHADQRRHQHDAEPRAGLLAARNTRAR